MQYNALPLLSRSISWWSQPLTLLPLLLSYRRRGRGKLATQGKTFSSRATIKYMDIKNVKRHNHMHMFSCTKDMLDKTPLVIHHTNMYLYQYRKAALSGIDTSSINAHSQTCACHERTQNKLQVISLYHYEVLQTVMCLQLERSEHRGVVLLNQEGLDLCATYSNDLMLRCNVSFS